MPRTVRPQIEQSWLRSRAAGVSSDGGAPPLLDPDSLEQVRAGLGVAPALPAICEVLGPAADDCDAVVAVFDPAGRMVWQHGPSSARRRAERIGFVEGSVWDERLAGTNAPGMALAIGAPAQIRGEEHYRQDVKSFGCVAAPILDPVTGRVAGVVDVTGRPRIATAQTMAAVLATARLAGTMLGSEPTAPARTLLHLEALGRDRALLRVQRPGIPRGPAVELSPRHSEILVLLCENEAGLTGDQLAAELYTDEVATSTLRAELNRLKALLGEPVLTSRPYRLRAEVDADWQRAARDGTLADYPGPLLPRSGAPGVERVRDRLHFAVRQAVLDSADPQRLATWTAGAWGSDDYEAWQALAVLAPRGSAYASLATGQLARLDAELI
ncbi:MAG: hypothetical protein ACK5MT_02035 [Actinomycetales bacterium]